MGKQKIVGFGDPVLRTAARPVRVFHKKLHSLLDSMWEVLDAKDNGAALAAPQISVLKKIVVIDYQDEKLELINPEICACEGEQTDYESCLSFPSYIGLVPRFEQVTVNFQTRTGAPKKIRRSGPMSRCLQHEIDHLNGILFVDRMVEEQLMHQETKETIDLKSVLEMVNGEGNPEAYRKLQPAVAGTRK